MNSKIRIPFIVAVISIAQIAQIAQAKCQETDPRNAANKRHGKQINCHGGGGWEETTYANGVEEGAKKRFDGSGRLQELKTFKDGKPNGPHKTYHENGKINEDRTLLNYNPDGIAKKFTEEGKLELEENYRAGKLHGIRKEYNERTGQLVKLETFADGVRNGKFEEYYENGKPRFTKNYKNANQQGEQKKYFDTGEIEETAEYDIDKKSGWLMTYHNNSDGYYLYSAQFSIKDRTKYYATFFAKGHQKEATCYDENETSLRGTETCTKEVKELEKKLNLKPNQQVNANGNTGENEFYANGKISKRCAVKNSKLHGKCETFYEDGTPMSISTYSDGKQVGESMKYWENGRTKSKSVRDNTGKLSKMFEYYKEGQLQKESKIENDREIAATEFFMNGSPKMQFKWVGKQKSFVRYHDNGKPELKANLMAISKCYYSCWDTLEYDGLVERFDEDGSIAEKSEYKNGELDGKSIRYYPNGKIEQERESTKITESYQTKPIMLTVVAKATQSIFLTGQRE